MLTIRSGTALAFKSRTHVTGAVLRATNEGARPFPDGWRDATNFAPWPIWMSTSCGTSASRARPPSAPARSRSGCPDACPQSNARSFDHAQFVISHPAWCDWVWWVGEGGHAGRLPILPRPAAQLSLYYPQWCHWSQSGPFRQ